MDNLARIRDNQRRSRARRKEYVQELEHRLRQAEQQGIYASTEIQAAARKVAEENKKLRHLLRLHGISDYSIQEFLTAGFATTAASNSQATTSTIATSTTITQTGSNTGRLENFLNQPQKPEISTMTGVNPHDVRNSLGCSPGMYCHVDNTKLSDTLERLTGPPYVHTPLSKREPCPDQSDGEDFNGRC
ncbi:hypothetical protein N0V88_003046 [Collariella sp. IMI 366227]|nr:hypothetical protein N0V88_003046 [Collariella sp. IMI 366227]